MQTFDFIGSKSKRNSTYLQWKHAVIQIGGLLHEKPYHFPACDETECQEQYEYGTTALEFWDKEINY